MAWWIRKNKLPETEKYEESLDTRNEACLTNMIIFFCISLSLPPGNQVRQFHLFGEVSQNHCFIVSSKCGDINGQNQE